MSRTIVLVEYQPQRLAADTLSETAAQRLWQKYAPLVSIDFPSPKTAGCWQLTAQGWVGIIPATPALTLILQPKLPIANLLGMVEMAYGLQALRLLQGTVTATTVPELYKGLAQVLAELVLQQLQRGLYRPYQAQAAETPYVRGRLQVNLLPRRPVATTIPCTFQEPTVDVPENQILYWTLHRLLHSDLLEGKTTKSVRLALRMLQPRVTLRPWTVADCRGRTYSRLSQSYAPLHALCAFFLEASGPSYQPGAVTSVPFVINMARLFEEFVATWLQRHLPPTWQLQIQERHPLSGELHFAIDLVLYERTAHRPYMVLDTKYKTPDRAPDTADVAQIVAYAAAKGVTEACLIYPQPLPIPLDTTVGGVHIRTTTFALDGALNAAGAALLAALGLTGNPIHQKQEAA